MAVFRVERNTGYTVMSNHHLRNKALTLKAKGLLSQMLSLPEGWDYTLAGLSHINRESIDAIRTAIWELEKAGYIVRRQGRDEKGKMTAIEYIIYEQPQPSSDTEPGLDYPMLENPTPGKPILENPISDKPTSENPTQINKDISKTDGSSKEKLKKDLSITEPSNPIPSNPQPLTGDGDRTRSRIGTDGMGARETYREIVLENIDYDILIEDPKMDREQLDEIAELIVDTVCSARKTIRIAGDDFPAEVVKSRFLKLDSSHVQYVMDCMRVCIDRRSVSASDRWWRASSQGRAPRSSNQAKVFAASFRFCIFAQCWSPPCFVWRSYSKRIRSSRCFG